MKSNGVSLFELIAASLQSTLLIDKPALLVIGFQPNQPQLTLLWFHFTSSLFNKSIIFVWIKLRKKVEWKRLIDGMRAGKEIYNPLRRNLKLMELILMKAAALSISLQSIISFHNKRKLNFSFFVSFNNWFYEIDWMELKKYYNSTVIRAGIYLLSAIMKNFVLNYERQLVDDCDNNERREPTKRNKSYLLFGFVERKSDMAESTTQSTLLMSLLMEQAAIPFFNHQSHSASFKLKKFNLICWIVNWLIDSTTFNIITVFALIKLNRCW